MHQSKLASSIRYFVLAVFAVCFCNLNLSAQSETETLPEGLSIKSVSSNLESIELKNKFDYRQLLLTGTLDDGQTADITRMAKVTSKPQFVSISETGLIRPIANGSEEISVEYGGFAKKIKVNVIGAEKAPAPSFIRHIQPVFSKMGCNAGTCHGSKDGKNGFKLSLRGYDALYDYRSFTDDIGARRFNRVAPDQSLMLLKASGAIPHVGGQLTKPGEPYYEILRNWIADGVKFDLETSPRVTKIDILPQNPIIPRAGMRQQITVIATYSDGKTKDVTQEAFIESGNIEVLEAQEKGIVKMLRRGESPVLVRYEGNYAATILTVMGDRSGFAWQEPTVHNYIDKHVNNKLKRMKILASGLCNDAEFVRRIYIDLTGLPPTAEQAEDFISDKRSTKEKRSELIDQLVGNREFVESWTNKWADLLQVNRKFLGEEGSVALRDWIKHNVASNRPYNEFAKEIITASGSTLENPPAAYYKVLRDPADLMENTTHLFLAVRFNCNKCHDHPFERWTQDQYYNLAAYFAQVGRKESPVHKGQRIGGSAVEGAKPLVEVIFDRVNGEIKHDRTGQTAPPSFPYEHEDLAGENAPRREKLAQWIASSKNQYFARSFVNRIWGYMFGTGIIEPIDDIRAGNPPTNPELLDALEKDFIESGFDVQHIIKVICNSRTYQASVVTNKWNVDDTVNYSHQIPRRLTAEALYDAIHFAAGAKPKIPGVPVGFRATQLPDAGIKVPFLDDFGKPVRESACECERSTTMVLGPVMKLVNGPTVANALADPQNEIHKLVNEIKDDKELIRKIFLRFLSRYPTDAEVELGLEAIETAGQGHERNVAAFEEYKSTLAEKQKTWEASFNRPVVWQTSDLTDLKSTQGANFKVNADKSVFVSGKLGFDTYTFTLKTDLKQVTGLRLEALADNALPAKGPGRAKNGNFVLNEIKVEAWPASKPEQKTPVKLANASATFSQQGWDVKGAIDGNEGSGWAVSPQFGKTHTAFFETKGNIAGDSGVVLRISFVQKFSDTTHSLGKFRLSVTDSTRPIKPSKIDPGLAKLISIPMDKRTEKDKAELLKRYLKTDLLYKEFEAAVKQTEAELRNKRLSGMQDLSWALINSPSFLFNR